MLSSGVAEITSLTAISVWTGDPPGVNRLILPLYVPAGRPVVSTLVVTAAEPVAAAVVPLPGLITIQLRPAGFGSTLAVKPKLSCALGFVATVSICDVMLFVPPVCT